jgi:hypothetical protein
VIIYALDVPYWQEPSVIVLVVVLEKAAPNAFADL